MADAWNEYAEVYESEPAVALFSAKTRELLRQQTWWSAGLRLLDYGCGPGPASIPLAKEDGLKVTGADISSTMIEKFEANGKRFQVEALGIHLEKEDGSEIESGKYDVVLCSFVLHHAAENMTAIVANLCKALRPRGHICIFEFERTERSEKALANRRADSDGGHAHDHHGHGQGNGHHHGHNHHDHGQESTSTGPHEVIWLEQKETEHLLEKNGLTVLPTQKFFVKGPLFDQVDAVLDCMLISGTNV